MQMSFKLSFAYCIPTLIGKHGKAICFAALYLNNKGFVGLIKPSYLIFLTKYFFRLKVKYPLRFHVKERQTFNLICHICKL